MELLKASIQAQFTEAFEPFLGLRALLRAAGDAPEAEVRAPPMVFDDEKERRRVVLEVRALTVEHEVGGEIVDVYDKAIEVMRTLQAASPIPPIRHLTYRAIAIAPYEAPFHDLVAKMKNSLLVPSDLVDSATDIALIFDEADGTTLRHLQIGPMDSEQLTSQFLRLEPDGVPETFVFMDLDYGDGSERNFDVDDLHELAQAAAKWQTEAESQISELVRVGG